MVHDVLLCVYWVSTQLCIYDVFIPLIVPGPFEICACFSQKARHICNVAQKEGKQQVGFVVKKAEKESVKSARTDSVY